MTDNMKTTVLALTCAAAMLTALLTTAWIHSQYAFLNFSLKLGIAGPLGITVIGFYIFIFLSANTVISTKPSLRYVALVVLAALLAGYVIVVLPSLHVIAGGGIFLLSMSWALDTFVLPGFMVFVSFIALMLLPTNIGLSAGTMVFLAARFLAGRAPWNCRAHCDSFSHCLGFVGVANCVFLSGNSFRRDLQSLPKEAPALLDFVDLLWPIFLGVPAVHLICVCVARYFCGWSAGEVHAKRLMYFSFAIFLLVGIVFGIFVRNWTMVVMWPVYELHWLKFWDK